MFQLGAELIAKIKAALKPAELAPATAHYASGCDYTCGSSCDNSCCNGCRGTCSTLAAHW